MTELDPGVAAPASTAALSRTGRHRPRWVVRVVVALLVATAVAATGYAADASDSDQAALGPGTVSVEVSIHHSRFDIGELRVHEGTLVQFVVRNDDPIDHELVIGDVDVHRRHANGSERRHPPVPGEVSITPGDTAMTYYVFSQPGTVTYACHLPGHIAYGMAGTIEVVPTS